MKVFSRHSLWKAAKKGDHKEVQRILTLCEKKQWIDLCLNFRHTSKGTTPLMIACSKKRLEVVRILLQFGADPNIKDSLYHQNTTLHYAVESNQAEIVQLLLDAGAKAFTRNSIGQTPLELAWGVVALEAAQALTQHLTIRSGWLYIRSENTRSHRNSQVHASDNSARISGEWKRRWCVALRSSAHRTAVDLCIYRRETELLPQEIYKLRSVRTEHTGVVPNVRLLDWQKDTCLSTKSYASSVGAHWGYLYHQFACMPQVISDLRGLEFGTDNKVAQTEWTLLIGQAVRYRGSRRRTDTTDSSGGITVYSRTRINDTFTIDRLNRGSRKRPQTNFSESFTSMTRASWTS